MGNEPGGVAGPRVPVFVDLAGRKVLVVGGGAVATRRAAALADAGADVVVVAPEQHPDLAADPRITCLGRCYRSSDIDGAWLVHTATGDPAVEARVAADADAARVWCIRADAAAVSRAWTPATARAGDVTVAVTAGADPRRSRAVCRAIAVQLENGDLPVRRHRGRSTGAVVLVGGGPGDPGLITARGRRALAEADVVVVDRLAPRELLAALAPEVEVIDVGKAPGHHRATQGEINRLLVDRARAGRLVVRLKGGDPFVFGRGAEEVQACRAAGVPVSVAPGVSSAFAGPAAAGIPVTHRGVSRSVTVVSAHDEVDWPSLAALEGTLVLLMGTATLSRSTTALLAHGADPHTPAAVVENATLPAQRVVLARLGTLAAVARSRGVRNPAVVVIGDVAALADDWGGSDTPAPVATALPG